MFQMEACTGSGRIPVSFKYYCIIVVVVHVWSATSGYDETNIGFIYLFNQWLFKYIYLNITFHIVKQTSIIIHQMSTAKFSNQSKAFSVKLFNSKISPSNLWMLHCWRIWSIVCISPHWHPTKNSFLKFRYYKVFLGLCFIWNKCKRITEMSNLWSCFK